MKNLKSLNRSLPETELCTIGNKHGTDKPGNGYTKVYYKVVKEYKDKPVDFFEIGVYFGASLRMWEEFFPKGRIFGIDNGRITPGSHIKTGQSNEMPSVDDLKLLKKGEIDGLNNFDFIENDKIKCYMADQRSEAQLKEAFEYFNCSEFDFILDDAQHYQEHQQKSLGLLFKNIKSGGYYIIEDVSDRYSLISGAYWGQRKKDASDSTDAVFESFIKTGKLDSIYLTEKECKYIEDNTDDIFMYDANNENNSPINGTSKLVVIKKK